MASCCEVESTKSVSEIFSPVSGTIAEVNSDLSDTPQMINEDPYGKGWIFAVEMSDAGEIDGLMDAAAYQTFLEG
jgi:glycine cleavage system H protein